MKISTPRRRMSFAAAVALAGGLSMAGMSSASAAVDGNLETKGPLYFCEDGSPQMVVYTRTTQSADTVSYTSENGEGSWTLEPNRQFGQVYSSGDGWAGVKDTITFKTAKTGDSLSVEVSIPTNCDGLPTAMPESGWKGEAVTPTGSTETTTEEPTETTSEEPTETTTEEPTTTDEPTGPPVETGVVSDGSNASTVALVSLLGMGVAGAGAAATARLSKR